MHVIQFVDANDEVLVERQEGERDKAFAAFDRALTEVPPVGAVAVLFRDDGRISRRAPVKEVIHAETPAAPAPASGDRERAGAETADDERTEPVPAPAADRAPANRPSKVSESRRPRS